MIVKQKKIEQNYNNHVTLAYQNTLLKERNYILSQQNQVLVAKIDQLTSQINSNRQIIQMFQNSDNTKQTDMSKLLSLTQSKIKEIEEKISQMNNCNTLVQVEDRFNIIKQLISNQCRPHSIIVELFETLKDVIAKNEQKKTQQQKLKKIQKQLNMRKKIYAKKSSVRQYIHVAKQPNYYCPSLSIVSYSDFPFLMQIYEKIVIRVKSESYTDLYVQNIFESIRKIVPMKKKMNELFYEVKDIQRQFQLGKVHQNIVHQVTSLLLNAQKQYETQKNSIERQIQNL